MKKSSKRGSRISISLLAGVMALGAYSTVVKYGGGTVVPTARTASWQNVSHR